jgi:hypothetical protein
MTKRFVLVLQSLLVLVVLGAASAAAAEDVNSISKFEVHVGDAFVTAFGFPAGTVTRASNGDTIEVVFTGKIKPEEGEAEGFGTFAQRSSTGALIAVGTFEAKELLSFIDFGTEADLSAVIHGGSASMLVRVKGRPASNLTDIGLASQFDSILEVDCMVGAFPAGFEEGITFAIKGGLNFDEKVSGVTSFVASP